MLFSKRTNWNLSPNPISEKLSQLKADGISVLDLTVSNPTLCHFSSLSHTLLKELHQPENLIYELNAHGLLAFREKLCRHYQTQDISIKPDQIFLTANTSEAYSYIFRLLMEPGDRLLAPSPSYPLLEFLASIQDVELVRYPLAAANQWQPDWRIFENAEIAPKALLTVHPNNPTGTYLSDENRQGMIQLAQKWKAAIISDEVFFDYPLGNGSQVSFAASNEVLTFTLGGISKFLALPQMKLSWMILTGPAVLVEQARARIEILADTFLSVSTPVQHAAVRWWDAKDLIQSEIWQRIRSNYTFLKQAFETSAYYKVLPIEGGWNAVLELPEDESAENHVLHLLEQKNVFLHPGYLFDFAEDRYLVISLLVVESVFQEGVSRLKA